MCVFLRCSPPRVTARLGPSVPSRSPQQTVPFVRLRGWWRGRYLSYLGATEGSGGTQSSSPKGLRSPMLSSAPASKKTPTVPVPCTPPARRYLADQKRRRPHSPYERGVSGRLARLARQWLVVFCSQNVPPREKGTAMSAENEHTGDGSVETQEEPREETGAESRDGAVALDDDHLLDLYKKMVLIRVFEEATQRGFRKGKIGGYLHVYTGQEAVATGFIDAYQEGDRVITAYRDHPFPLLLGSDPKEVMAELYGKGSGIVKGKGGSMHLFDVEHGFYGGYGIVGQHIPLGVGIAYALAYKETGEIIQLYLGDGAMNGGPFLESANLAGLWGMDGMDLEAVLEVAHRATEQVRETGRPYAVEAITYRTAPHGAADFFEKYRTKDEVQKWRQRDPIGLLEHKLIERGVIGEDDVEEIRDEMQETINEVTSFADESEEPPE